MEHFEIPIASHHEHVIDYVLGGTHFVNYNLLSSKVYLHIPADAVLPRNMTETQRCGSKRVSSSALLFATSALKILLRLHHDNFSGYTKVTQDCYCNG